MRWRRSYGGGGRIMIGMVVEVGPIGGKGEGGTETTLTTDVPV